MRDPFDVMQEEEDLERANALRKDKGLPALAEVADARAWLEEYEKAEKAGGGATVAEPGETRDNAVVESPAEAPDRQAEPVQPAAEAKPDVAAPGEIPVASRRQAQESETERLKAEVQRLKSEDGRCKALQSKIDALESKLDEAIKRAEEAQRKADEAEARASGKSLIESVLTPEQREALDPNDLAAVVALAERIADTKGKKLEKDIEETRNMLRTREQAEQARESQRHEQAVRDMFATRIAPEIPPTVYGRFAADPKWAEWLESRYAGSTRGEIYARALENLDADAAKDQLLHFMRFAGITIPAKADKPPVRPEADKGGGGTPSSGSNAPKTFFDDEVSKFEEMGTKGRLPSAFATWDEYGKWSEMIDKARAEGRVIDRATKQPVY